MRYTKLANPLRNHVVAGNLARTRIVASLLLACATCLHTLTFSTAPVKADAIPINITIDESVEGQPPLVTANGLAAQVVGVQTISPETWQIDITGDVSEAVGGGGSFVNFLQLSEPGFPEQVSDILTLTSMGGAPGTVHVQMSFLLQSDEEGNPLSSVGVSETEAALGNTITFGQFITGTLAGFTTFPLNVTLISDLENVPEPSTGVLAVIACGIIWLWRKRFK